MSQDCMFNKPGNLSKGDVSRAKRRNGGFVGGVQHGSKGSATSSYVKSQSKCGESVLVWGLKMELERGFQIEPAGNAFGPLGIGEGVLDRGPHIRGRKLRNDRAINELDHRMNDRFGVNHHLDLLGCKVK